MKTELFDYTLPEELIAFHPVPRRESARLLCLKRDSSGTAHCLVSDLPSLLPKGSLLVCNDTRVIRARMRAHRSTGGSVELLFVRCLCDEGQNSRWCVLAKANKPIRVGDILFLENGTKVPITHKGSRGMVELEVPMGSVDLLQLLKRFGEVPLPPYIRRVPVPQDRERYQTVFARFDGSVAAPTAGLHFTNQLLAEIAGNGCEVRYVTLHVGPGTFRPINTDELHEHKMDEEYYSISEETSDAINRAKDDKRPIIAVGTTVVRALEGHYLSKGGMEPASSESTKIFIAPPFEFKVVDGLMTNFHLPKSTLLCLVSALVGRERILRAYKEAVERKYRFYSYGDAMLILPETK